MNSNDEDLDLFLDELCILLNKYHYTFPKGFSLSKITPPNYYVAGFGANGDGNINPLYIPAEIYHEVHKNED